MLLVNTPRGTVSLPSQGFFQQQPSPFASQLTPTGLPFPRPPVQLTPRIPAPADLDSASLVRPPAPATIPSSSSFNNFTRRRSLDQGIEPFEGDPFKGAPVSDPANPNSVDPAQVLGAAGFLAAGPPGALGGKVVGNVISAATAPRGALHNVSYLSALANVLSPFGIIGNSIHTQTIPFKQGIQLLDFENSIAKQQQETRRTQAFKRLFRIQFPDAAEEFEGPVISPTFGVIDPQVLGIPEAGDISESFSGMGQSFGQNAANTGQEDAAEDPDSPGDSPGGSVEFKSPLWRLDTPQRSSCI